MSKLKIGDTIQCHDEKDMLSTHANLMKNGVWCDWLDIKEQPPKKWRLTITGFDKELKNE